MSKNLYSLEVEKACLGAAMKFQDELMDVLPFVTPDHYYFEAHKTIFSCIKSILQEGKKFDSIILIEKLAALGLASVAGIDTHDYVYSLSNLEGVNKASFFEYFQTLHKYFNARKLVKNAKDQIKFVEGNLDKKSSEILSGVEKIFASDVNTFQQENDPKDIFNGLKEKIELRGNSPVEDGVINPYPEFRRYFGNFLHGGLYVVCAPAKNGKSTLLLDIGRKTAKKDKVRALYLDTELTTEEQENRLVSSYSGVNEFYIRTGKYRNDAEMTSKVRKIWPIIESMEDCFDHLYVAGKPIDEIISIIRRWHYKNIRAGMKSIVIYDYIKLTGEKISDSWKEYQVIGEKTDKLKQIAQELKCPVVAAVQTNAENNVAMSKQIRWFANMVAIFKKKDPTEIQRDGVKFGTHIFTVIDSRNQGEAAMGFNDIIKMPDDTFERFYINFEFQNFNIEERGTLLDVVEAMKNTHVHLDDGNDGDGDIPF